MGFDPVSYAMGAKAGGGGGGATVVRTTFTSASDQYVANIPLPNIAGLPVCVKVLTQTSGTEPEDFELGELLSVFVMPVEEEGLGTKTKANGINTYRRLDNGSVSSTVMTKSRDSATMAYNNYNIGSGEISLKVSSNARFLAGLTYDVTFYYAG